MTRRFPNGGTHVSTTHVLRPEHIGPRERTRGSEPSQYPEAKENNSDSVSSGERTRTSLNRRGMPLRGRGIEVRSYKGSG